MLLCCPAVLKQMKHLAPTRRKAVHPKTIADACRERWFGVDLESGWFAEKCARIAIVIRIKFSNQHHELVELGVNSLSRFRLFFQTGRCRTYINKQIFDKGGECLASVHGLFVACLNPSELDFEGGQKGVTSSVEINDVMVGISLSTVALNAKNVSINLSPCSQRLSTRWLVASRRLDGSSPRTASRRMRASTLESASGFARFTTGVTFEKNRMRLWQITMGGHGT